MPAVTAAAACTVVIRGCRQPQELAEWLRGGLPLLAPVPGFDFDGSPMFQLSISADEAHEVVRDALAGCPYPFLNVEVHGVGA
jgi:hypothetical protein